MSYNIDHVETTVLDAYMLAEDIRRLHNEHSDAGELAECNFIDDHIDEALQAIKEKREDQRIKLRNFDWYGCWSGNSYELLEKKIVPFVKGRVEAIFTWEGGDSEGAMIIKDGKQIECELEKKIVPKK